MPSQAPQFCQSDPIVVRSGSLLGKTTRKRTIEIHHRCNPQVFEGIALLNQAEATQDNAKFYNDWHCVQVALEWLKGGMAAPAAPAVDEPVVEVANDDDSDA